MPKIEKTLSKIIDKKIITFDDRNLRLSRKQLDLLSEIITGFGEDLHCNMGIWKAYENCNIRFFSQLLPFHLPYMRTVSNEKFNKYRCRHLIWKLYEQFMPEYFIDPYHEDIEALGDIISSALPELFNNLPRQSVHAEIFLTPNIEAADVKRKLIWLGLRSYMFKLAYHTYLVENNVKPEIPVIDDFVCQENTLWSGLGVIDILSEMLPVPKSQKEELSSWYERHFAYYKIKTIKKENIIATNIINNLDYDIMTYETSDLFKTDEIYFGGLVKWREKWAWSGAQYACGKMEKHKEPEFIKLFKSQSAKVIYRYDKNYLQKATESLAEMYKDFVAYFKSDLVVFPDGLTMAAELQKKDRFIYENSMTPKELEEFKKEHSLNGNFPAYQYPEHILQHEEGIGVYFNPAEGIEISLGFNHIISGLKKEGKELNDDEVESLFRFMESDALSIAFANRIIQDYGGKISFVETFCLDISDIDTSFNYILRKYKGNFFRNRYPDLTLKD
ncbi:MAG TPA: DUF3843 family protein [Candidatus Cloacimonas sp.]|nr:DUF3843 family protein [Candidatus Cloacimonas sp.]